jgi:hypothetical protein
VWRLHRVLLYRIGEASRIDWSRVCLDLASAPAKRERACRQAPYGSRQTGFEVPRCFGPKGRTVRGSPHVGQRPQLKGLRVPRRPRRADQAPGLLVRELPAAGPAGTGGASGHTGRAVAPEAARGAPRRPRSYRRDHSLPRRSGRTLAKLRYALVAQLAHGPGVPDRGRSTRDAAERGAGRLAGDGGCRRARQVPARRPRPGSGLCRLRTASQGPGREARRGGQEKPRQESPFQPTRSPAGSAT